MVKKIDELVSLPKDPNSPESQEFLRKLHERSVERQAKMKKMVEEWQEEDRKDAAN